jgi:hypothetical protein
MAAFEPNGAVLAFPKVRVGLPKATFWRLGRLQPKVSGPLRRPIPTRPGSRLEKQTGADYDVKNAGVGGELAAKTLERLKSALKSGWARLVIWQVGTNDAIVGVDETLFRATVQAGIVAAHAAAFR